MEKSQQHNAKINLTFKQKIGLLLPYLKKRIIMQVKAVALIIVYLIFFQTIILNIPVSEAASIGFGIAVVIIGLAFFIEGLFLGLMPLGEVIGIKLPQKTNLPIILTFAFVLGIGATYAEPAIGVLRAAQSFIKAWNAPLLFAVLNKYSHYLVYSVGAGVGIAILFGMLRFLYNWSLKPFIYILVSLLVGLSGLALFDPNMKYLTGVAWDCGAVTTGPVTVPLVLALGIGICRIMSNRLENQGFGVVTLASLFPILSVLLLGAFLMGHVPPPMDERSFFKPENREKVTSMFNDDKALIGYALMHANIDSQITLFNGSTEKMLDFIRDMKNDAPLRKAVFGYENPEVLQRWAIERGTAGQRLAVFENPEAVQNAWQKYLSEGTDNIRIAALLTSNGILAAQAIIPLTAFLLLVLIVVLKEKLPQYDKIFLGIIFALVGMALFNLGNELGLIKLGNQVGSKLPSTFKKIELTNEKIAFSNFDENIIHTAVQPDGSKEEYFFANIKNDYIQIPFHESSYDRTNSQYLYTPTTGPLYGSQSSITGYLVVLLFAFIMGYGATLAEPALNALGITVEEITIGTFKKASLMRAVAIGVGVGMTFGVIKIIWNIPLIWLLAPPYILLIVLTKISTEEFVNIGWDSAGVTTGPITVPLVLAMGLGIGNQVNVMEGFGILAMASVYPILSVLVVGLSVNAKRKSLHKEANIDK